MESVRNYSSASPSILTYINPLDMFVSLYSYRDLIRQFAWREVIGRYKGTYLGLIWSLIHPVMTLAVYTLVFGFILKSTFGGEGGGKINFALNLFCGLIIYEIFSGTIIRSPALITMNSTYVTKVIFPIEVLPVALLFSNLVNAALSLLILIPSIILVTHKLTTDIFLLPIILIPLFAMTLGLSWFLSSMGVFLRDIGQIVVVVLQLLFFLSPVIYPVSAIPVEFRFLFDINPLTSILEGARGVLMSSHRPQWGLLAVATAISLVFMQMGYMWFMRCKRAFPDVL